MAAIHGIQCEAKTFPARCRGCDTSVVFFACNCGSRVSFDELGPPWPVHDCGASWTRGLVRTSHQDGSVSVQTRQGISIIRPARDFGVEPAFLSRARRRLNRDAFAPIVRIDPSPSGSKRVIGVLRGIARSADPFKAFNLPETDIALAMLGDRWRRPVGKITVHLDDGTSDQMESYNAWIPSSLIADGQIDPGITAALSLTGVSMINGDTVWFCDDFEPLT